MVLSRVLITDEVSDIGLNILKRSGVEFDYKPGIGADELIDIVGNYVAIVVRSRTKVTREVIEKGRKLKIIARVGVGLENIDIKTAKEKGIKIITAGAATADSVAELTIGLMIALARPIIFGDETMRRGFWAKKFCYGIELAEKTLGIIGVGNIGRRVAQIAKAMNMHVIGFDIIRQQVDSAGIEYREFKDLLRESDVISIHVPLVESTRGMIGRNEIELMKDGILIINTARMEIIDLDALIRGLESGKIGGYAADSNLKPNNPLVKKLLGFPNVILTPHIGAQTREAQKRAAEVVFKSLVEEIKKLE